MLVWLGERRRARNDAWRRRRGSCDHDNTWHARRGTCPKIVLAVALVAACTHTGGGQAVRTVRGSAASSPAVTGDPLPGVDAIGDIRATTSTRLSPHRASRSRPAPRRADTPQPARVPVAIQATGSIQQAICEAFGAACQWALRVAKCESGYNPRATNGQFRGLLQVGVRIHAARLARMGFTSDQMWEVGPNLAVAHAIYSESGPRAWQCK